MRKIAASLGPRGLQLLRLAGASVRLARAQEPQVAQHARHFLAQSMGRLKGLPQKVGQILSMAEGAPADSYEALTESSEALPFAVVEQVLAHEWKRPWREVLAEIDPAGKAASLGQVHRARLLGGEPVAVKVQYPGIAKAVQADLKLLGWLTLPLSGLGRQFNLAGYREEMLRDLLEELDYLREAENQHQYHFLSRYQAGLVVPAVHGRHCTPRVLVCGWEEGATLAEAAQWAEPLRKAAARLFLEHALGFFRNGFIHADPHPGNFRFRRTPTGEVELLLYDFGCIFRAELPIRLALLRLIQMTEENAIADPYPLFIALGFNPDYLEPLAGRLPALCRVLFEPFIVNAPYTVKQWNLGERVADVLGEDRWNFRIAGPPSLIFLMRVFHGIIHVLNTLGVPAPWKFLLDPIQEQFAAQAAALPLAVPSQPERGFGRVAKHLRIHVSRGGQTTVMLTSPLRAIDQLREMMGEELLLQVRSQDIDLDGIVRTVRHSGYCPQEVFRLDTAEKTVRVWLE